MFHAGNKIRLRSLKWKMEMIAHEHPGMDLPAMVRTNLAEPKQKRLAVVGGHKSGIAAVAAGNDDPTRLDIQTEVASPCRDLARIFRAGRCLVNP